MTFWLWVMRFAYRRAVKVTAVPDGVPTVRSMESPCPGYSPRRARLNDWTDCETDGHYLCQECCHKKEQLEADEPKEKLDDISTDRQAKP